MGWLRVVIAFIAAAVGAAVLATIAQTQFVVRGLNAVGAGIGPGDRMAMTLADLAGLAPLYGGFIAVALLIAFLAAALTTRIAPLPRPLVLAVAGGAAMTVMLLLMQEVFFGVQLIAGARFAPGFAAQVVCGVFAGLVFAGLTPGPRKGA